jgi:hypothetical protein
MCRAQVVLLVLLVLLVMSFQMPPHILSFLALVDRQATLTNGWWLEWVAC